MPILNNASRLFFGSQSVSRALLRGNTLWQFAALSTTGGFVSGQDGVPYESSVQINGTYIGPVTITGTDGVPPGLTPVVVGSQLVLAGTPSVEDDFDLEIDLESADGQQYQHTQTLTIGEEPPVGIVWAGGWGVDINGGVAVGTRDTGGNLGVVYTDEMPATPFYVEMSCVRLEAAGNNANGIWATGNSPADPGTFSHVGAFFNAQNVGVASGSQFSATLAARGGTVDTTNNPDTSLWPEFRWGWAIDPTTGELWVRQVWEDGDSGWWGDGDPETGDDPTETWESGENSDVLRLAATVMLGRSAIIQTPDAHMADAPTGFTAI